jgi:hypothetical protein
MKAGVEALPDDVETLKAALSRARRRPRRVFNNPMTRC